MSELEKAVTKIKKQINLECNTLPLIDEDLMRIKREQEEAQRLANEQLSEEVRRHIIE